jgi:hypothetical protein
MGFVKVSMYLHTRVAAKTRPAHGELLQVAVNREEFIKLRARTRPPVISKRDGQYLKPE